MQKSTIWLLCGVWVAAMLVAGRAHALPALTETQQQQLATTEDGNSVVDGPGLYPLLDNVSQWPDRVETGAAVPDYDAIAEHPEKYRGGLFLLEGEVAGPVQSIRPLRPGPWGDTIEQWTIKHGPDWEDVAVVYLANPAPDVRPRTRVRMPARFYKVWAEPDQDGNPSEFLVFVAQSSKLGKEATMGVDIGNSGSGFGGPAMVIGGTLILGALAFSFFWRRLRAAGSRELRSAELTRRRREAREAELKESGEIEAIEPNLPEDPDSALDELARRHGETGEGT